MAHLFRVLSPMQLEPGWAPKGAMAGKIRNGRQIGTLTFRQLLHPRRRVLKRLRFPWA